MKVIFGEDMKFIEVKIAGQEAMLKCDGEDFTIGQPVYLVEPGMEPVIVDSEAEFILEDGRKIETGNDGLVTEISTESLEDVVEPIEEEMGDYKKDEKKEEMEMPADEPKKEDEKEEEEPKKEEMEDPMESLAKRVDELTSKLDNIMKSLPENMSDEMEKMKKEIKMLKNEPIAEKFESEGISTQTNSSNFKSYLMNLQKNIN